MKRALRCHDFDSGQGAARNAYREYAQGAERRHEPKLVPAPNKLLIISDIACGVAAGIGAAFVGRLSHIRDMTCAVLRVIADSGRNAHVFHYVRHSKVTA